FQNNVSANRVRLLPAVRHTAAIPRIPIDEDDKAPVDAEVAGIMAIVITNVGEITPNLVDGWITLGFFFVVQRPAEIRVGGQLQQLGNAAIFALARSPPGGNGHLNAGIALGRQMLPDERGIRRVIPTQRRSVV